MKGRARAAGGWILACLACSAVPPPAPGSGFPRSEFDYADRFYAAHGVDPSGLRDRPDPGGGAAVAEPAGDPDRRDLRVLETRPGYDAAGGSVFFRRLGSVPAAGFLPDAAGTRAREIADRHRVFVFPQRQDRSASLALSRPRQDPLFDTTEGEPGENPLGLRRLAAVHFTDRAFSSAPVMRLLEGLTRRNLSSLDGTPILKRVSEIRELQRQGIVRIDERPVDGSAGPPWVLWRTLPEPEREGAASDSFLVVVPRADGAPVDPQVEQDFLCISQARGFLAPPMLHLVPFVQPLPIPPDAPARPALLPPVDRSGIERFAEFPPVRCFELRARPARHRFHPDLAASHVWGYDGQVPGPTIRVRRGEPFAVRYANDLSAGDNLGFGQPWTVFCLDLFPASSASAGFPLDWVPPGARKDFLYTALAERPAAPIRLGTGWFHDARLGFSAENVYKGLAGFVLAFDEADCGDENSRDPRALGLPSGEFDVPLLLADRDFGSSPEHPLAWDAFDLDGFLGSTWTVNGAVQPFFRVARRKYRFRLLAAGPSRFYDLGLSGGRGFTLIARGGALLGAPREEPRVWLSPSDRADVVVDFTSAPLGSELFLENRLVQASGKGHEGGSGDPASDRRVLKFIVDRDAADPSRVPSSLGPRPGSPVPEDLSTRTFAFENYRGSWTINGQPVDLGRVDAKVKKGTDEVWILKNAGDRGTHPITIRAAGHRLLSRTGGPPGGPDPEGTGVVELRPGEEARFWMSFRDWTGRFVLECGDAVHADQGLMIRWDVEP